MKKVVREVAKSCKDSVENRLGRCSPKACFTPASHTESPVPLIDQPQIIHRWLPQADAPLCRCVQNVKSQLVAFGATFSPKSTRLNFALRK